MNNNNNNNSNNNNNKPTAKPGKKKKCCDGEKSLAEVPASAMLINLIKLHVVRSLPNPPVRLSDMIGEMHILGSAFEKAGLHCID
jgi:hypothetical protein